jgi:steroid 5-alpha reductase family enzyme
LIVVRYHLERFARTEDARHVARDARFNKIGRGRRGVVDAFVWQLAWSLLCVLPVVLVHAVPDEVMGAHASQVRLTDILGLSTFVVGYILETGADWQKEEWARLRAEKKHKEEFFRGGLWTYW